MFGGLWSPCPSPCARICHLYSIRTETRERLLLKLVWLLLPKEETMKKKTITAVLFALLMIATGSLQARADNPLPLPIPGAR